MNKIEGKKRPGVGIDERERELTGERPADVLFGGGAHPDQGLAHAEPGRPLADEPLVRLQRRDPARFD
jgi:hypothetical protein